MRGPEAAHGGDSWCSGLGPWGATQPGRGQGLSSCPVAQPPGGGYGRGAHLLSCMDLEAHAPYGHWELRSVSQPKVPELDLPPLRPGGPGCTGGQSPGRLGQEATLGQRSLSPRPLTKRPTSVSLSFRFCKMGLFTAIGQGGYGAWTIAKLKTIPGIVKITVASAPLYCFKLVLLLLASANCQVTCPLPLGQ